MSRPHWKTTFTGATLIRYRFRRRGAKAQHIELGFFLKHFYHLLLDPAKFIRYNIYARSSTIVRRLRGRLVRVYRGFRWRTFFVTRWHVGFKWGEFSKTRQRAVFRAKTLKKKNKRHIVANSNETFLKNLQISRVRHLKSGAVRKNRAASLVAGVFTY